MKSFLEWFRGSTKVKRWMFLIILGIILTCYGFTKVLVNNEMDFAELIRIIGIFVIGFVFVVLGIVFIQKRNLEILIEANNNSENSDKAKINIKSLIFNRKVYEEGPKIVVIGGGEGLNTVIEGLKKYTNNITAIVTMSDYGLDPTKSRKALEMLPLNDIKSSIIAMSDKEELMRNLMNLKFKNDLLKDLNFGDIYLLAMSELYDNISEAIQKSTEVLNITGKVIPVTLDEITICAELTDGTVIERKDKIPEIVSERIELINRIYISPSNCRPAPGVIEAIQEAEAIIIGPGSLYTNVLPNLLVKNVSKAIKESKAIKMYISNIMTEPGQTDNYSLSDHIRAIKAHVGDGVFDYCLADEGYVVPEYIRQYNKEGSDIVESDIDRASKFNVKIISRNMSCIKNNRIRHNPDIIANTIIELICNELKFKDLQNETEYLLINSILKEQNKEINNIEKENKKEQKIVNKATKRVSREKRKPSKFFDKYKDRIESIQTSEKKIKEKIRIEEEINNIKTKKRGRKKKEEENLLVNQINKLNKNRKDVRKKIKEDKNN
ncbi:MAG: uridine diphosphate-N-acetylglucosamine-binding protein YvcK [Candidatus Scatovivens sp.]